MDTAAPRVERRRVRVAVVAPSTRLLGGQAVQAERLIRAWAGDPDVCAWLVPINPLPPAGFRWLLAIAYLRTLVTQLAYWPLLFRELRRADVVHVFSASYFSFLLAPLPAILVAKLLGRPVVLNYRSGEAPDHLRRSALARTALRRVDRILVPSTFLRDVFATFGLQADVVPNIVDLERFCFRARNPLRPRLVSTRNFEGLYNVACTLRAFRLVQDEYADAVLTLVGSGSLEPALRRLATDLSLSNVSFAGRSAPEEIHHFYADADIYVQTPDIDNMPASLLEAFSSGTPAVSTDAGGVPAILSDEVDGLLAPVGDHEAVARQVLRLLREPDLAARLATTARARCEQYTWPRVRGQWLSVYRVLARPGLQAGTGDVRRGTIARVQRMRAMDAREIRTRARTLVRRVLRRLASAGRTPRWRRGLLRSRLVAGDPALKPILARLGERDWLGAHRELMRHFQHRPSGFPIDPLSRHAVVTAVVARFPFAREDAQRQADAIVSGRYDLLGYEGLEFRSGAEASPAPPSAWSIDWKFDPVHGRRAAAGWWSGIRYLEPSNGDHKIIWELNRQQHWLTLGRAYWLTDREEYRTRFIDELESWLDQNRPLAGINWASMLELALRGLSWIWALHFFLDDTADPRAAGRETPWLVDLLLGLDRQMRHVEENLSHYFSPNTHLTGEALGLYVAGRVLPELRGSARWQALGRQVLVEQAAAQVLADGGHVERSTHYHRYTLDFYLLALVVARRTGDVEAAAAFEPVVGRLARFASALADANGWLPRIGDDDAGTLWRIGRSDPADVRPSLSIAASLLPGQVPVHGPSEEDIWIAGVDAATQARAAQAVVDRADRSAAFPATGYYVARSRSGDHLVFDAGPHGFLNGGHAHADALSVSLSLRRQPFLIDTGTGVYTADVAVRDRFRSTALHNTLLVDGRGQSIPHGPFHWAASADARPIRWASNPRFDFMEGAHDAYAPAIHRRAIFADGAGAWIVVDHLLGSTERSAAVHWHIHPDWHVGVDEAGVEAAHPAGLRALLASTARRMEIFRGDPDSGLGWWSPAYGRIVPATTVRFSRAADLPFSIATLVEAVPDARGVAIEAIPATPVTARDAVRPAGYAHAVRILRCDSVDLALFAVDSEDRDQEPGTRNRHREKWQFGGFETDARFCRVCLDRAGEVRAVSLVDGSCVLRAGDEPFSLRLEHGVSDLAVEIDADGRPQISASGPLPPVVVDAPVGLVAR